MAIEAAYAALVVYFNQHGAAAQKLMEANGAMLTSLLLSVLLALRTNSAYDRWWEGRKLWGQLVNDSRNLSIKLRARIADSGELKELARLQIAFPYALRNYLRGEPPDLRLASLGFDKAVDHLPLQIANQLSERIEAQKKEGVLTEMQLLLLDPHVRALMDVSGACERILGSPLAGAYKNMIWLGVGGYLLALPWLLAPTLENWTVLFVLGGTYFVVGLEMLAEEVERPFGHDANDIALTPLCKKIEANITEIMGQKFEDSSTADLYATSH